MLHTPTKTFHYDVYDYLINCDLVYKYGLRSIYQKPTIKKLVIHFVVKNLTHTQVLNKNLQIKVFLIFLILFFHSSFINFGCNHKKTTNVEYSLKTVLSNVETIHNFLLHLFLENQTNEYLTSAGIHKNVMTYKDSVCVNTLISGKMLFDCSDFFNQCIENIKFEHLQLHCCFILYKCAPRKRLDYLFKNISFF